MHKKVLERERRHLQKKDSIVSENGTHYVYKEKGEKTYISLTSHADRIGIDPLPIRWGASMDAQTRGAIYCSSLEDGLNNAIGCHGGSYGMYYAISVATGALDPNYISDYKDTEPFVKIGPFPSWVGKKIVTIDPFGAIAPHAFKQLSDEKNINIKPTIAITKAHIEFPEITIATKEGRLKPDGEILLKNGQSNVTKAAIDPVYYLPGVAERFNITESKLREILFMETNHMYPELVTRNDLKIFLPPIGGITVYIWGDPERLNDPNTKYTIRNHDSCAGSDVFGSDICTCRPYLAFAIEECIKQAQEGGLGIVCYFQKEGRSLSEITKYLVYNKRKRQEGGDAASEYFSCTKAVAGVEDQRFQQLMPDVLHWLGIKKIDRFVSMSNMKYDAIVNSGIKIIERVPLPADLVPDDAQVEIMAKVHAGYEGGKVYKKVDRKKLKQTKGRALEKF